MKAPLVVDGMLVNYPGSKTATGVMHQILNQMPRHFTYIEPFVGTGAVLMAKRRAGHSIVLDANPMVVEYWKSIPWVDANMGDAVQWLDVMRARLDSDGVLIYADPPYLGTERTGNLYAYELQSDEDHRRLLRVLRRYKKAQIMLSGYMSKLYTEELKGWRVVSYKASTRGGVREEFLWMNFPEGLPLHDCSLAGQDYREREIIKRKRDRWASKFAKLPALQRQVIREALEDVEAGLAAPGNGG